MRTSFATGIALSLGFGLMVACGSSGSNGSSSAGSAGDDGGVAAGEGADGSASGGNGSGNTDGSHGDAATGGGATTRSSFVAVGLTLGNQVCAWDAAGDTRCWGSNGNGEQGNGTTSMQPVTTPARVAGLGAVAEMSAGDGFTCARLKDGTASCWGVNESGELGDGTFTYRLKPVPVAGLTNLKQIAAGSQNACAILADDTVSCWGDGGNGGLAAKRGDSGTPLKVAGLAHATQLSVGVGITCALRSDHSVACWGDNEDGAIGNGTEAMGAVDENVYVPTSVSGLSDATEVSAGAVFVAALRSDGSVVEWGHNDGWLGQTSPTTEPLPTPVPDVMATSSLSAYGLGCALTSGGDAVCWDSGRVTHPLAGVAGLTKIATYGKTICGLLTDGSLRCAGDNAEGQLGDGSVTSSETPVTPLL